MNTFRALVLNKLEENEVVAQIENLTIDQLPEGDVTIQVLYSSVNYKDGLASMPKGGVVRAYPFIPGIDLAGFVVDSKSPRFKEGDEVLVTGYELGVSHFGGYSQVARVPADWIVPLPKGLTLKEAMAIGTAGFTAALSIHRLEENGLTPDKGTVLVTGSTGGVGSSAVAMLSKLGYSVIASTRKKSEISFLEKLGAKEMISPEELVNPKQRPLLKQRFAAAVDPVAGDYLPVILSSIHYGGSVAVSGLTAGNQFTSTVFPFILRGVNLLGIDSVYCPMELRSILWDRLATDMKPKQLLDGMSNDVTLEQLPDILPRILKGEIKGRTVVSLHSK